MRLVILYILLLLPFPMMGQDKYTEAETILYSLFSRLGSAADDQSRLGVNDSICGLIEEYSRSENVFTHTFPSLRFLGQVTSTDSTLKIITWNVNLENFHGKYFSYLILKSDEGSKNKILSLQSSYSIMRASDDTTYTDKNWYGALYYAIRPFTFNAHKYYLVLGLDYGNPQRTRKLIDVIRFNDDGSAVFGKKWFETNRGVKYRKIFEYASAGTMSLRFNSDTSIVFDHLVPIASESGSNQVFYGSDFSYDSYTFSNGMWNLRLNVDARNNEH